MFLMLQALYTVVIRFELKGMIASILSKSDTIRAYSLWTFHPLSWMIQ